MKKATKLILMICFILSEAFCFANGELIKMEKGDEITIDLLEATSCMGPSRSSSIIPKLNGHVLTVVFNENLGQVSVE